MSLGDLSNSNENPHVDAEQPLRGGEDRISGDMENNDVEEKMLNVGQTFPRNIQREEFEYSPSDVGSSSARQSDLSQHPILYRFRHRTLWMGLICTIVFCILSVALSVYAVVKYSEAITELRIARENREKVCLPCEEQKIQISSWKERIHVKDGECCVRLEELLYQMDEVARDEVTEQLKKASPKSSYYTAVQSPSSTSHKASAHITHRVKTWSNGSEYMAWQNSDPMNLSHVSEGLVFYSENTGEIMVPRAGYYYLYSQLTIYATAVSNVDKAMFKFEIKVKERYSDAKTVLSSANLKWKSLIDDKDYYQQANYVGGVFYIPAGAHVYVQYSSKEKQLYKLGCKTSDCFFGIVQL